jgi:2-dehydro-3-deoxy-D-arabinonate dehydratase
VLLYRTSDGLFIGGRADGPLVALPDRTCDDLFTGAITKHDFEGWLSSGGPTEPPASAFSRGLLPPIGSQEVWAAGVTFLRSRTARMDESAIAGGSDFYDRVYQAHRPELFFKATPHRVVGHGQTMRLRRDAHWNVPEPELTLAFSSSGALLGYCAGNDLSSRDIEGENPLYLPQAKVFDTCAALGPGLLLTDVYPSGDTNIRLSIRREDVEVFSGQTQVGNMKQSFENLREHLFRHNSFPHGCYLMTGTGIVPTDDFALQPGDEISITIDAVGTLMNVVA